MDKDPKKMERAILVTYMFDPDRLIDPKLFEKLSEFIPKDYKIEVATEAQILVAQSTEALIKRTEELKGIGFDHIIFGNMSVDGQVGVKVFEGVLPHIS